MGPPDSDNKGVWFADGNVKKRHGTANRKPVFGSPDTRLCDMCHLEGLHWSALVYLAVGTIWSATG